MKIRKFKRHKQYNYKTTTEQNETKRPTVVNKTLGTQKASD